jgi:hypothetical protein
MEIDHYLPLLIKRPGAFPYARPVRQWQMPEVYRDFLQALSINHNGDSPRLFLQVLAMGRRWGRENLEQAMSRALLEERADIERVRQLLFENGGVKTVSMPRGYLEQVRVTLPDLRQYDLLRTQVATERRVTDG